MDSGRGVCIRGRASGFGMVAVPVLFLILQGITGRGVLRGKGKQISPSNERRELCLLQWLQLAG